MTHTATTHSNNLCGCGKCDLVQNGYVVCPRLCFNPLLNSHRWREMEMITLGTTQ